MGDSTQVYTASSQNFAAALFYQGPSPDESKLTMDYNVYAVRTNPLCAVDVYRYVNTDISGSILDLGYRGEFDRLTQWQNWMQTDVNSVSKPFMHDLVTSTETFPKLRMTTDPKPVNSPLDNTGTFVSEAERDIDDVLRNVNDQRADIGAQSFEGEKYNMDLEAVNIYEPATYKSGIGPFKDAEYFMIDNKPIKVRVYVKNNGNTNIFNRSVTLTIYQEPLVTNNANAAIHNQNYTEHYYNREDAHYRDNSTFSDIDNSSAAIFYTESKNISVVAGEGIYVEFQLPAGKEFETYWELHSRNNLFQIPIQFSTMASNVTPRYKITILVDQNLDQDWSNNYFEKYVRCFVKKSRNDMLIVAYNTYNKINDTTSTGQHVPYNRVTNPDFVAGKLNLDSLITAFNRLGLVQANAQESDIHDFDVLDRKAWDFRNIDLTLYKTVFVSDETNIDSTNWALRHYDFTQRNFQDKWFAKNLTDFLQQDRPHEKTNLIVGSEEFVSDIYRNPEFLSLNYNAKYNLVRNYLRADLLIDSMTDKGITSYIYLSPLFGVDTLKQKLPTDVERLILAAQPYQYPNRVGTLTGRTFMYGLPIEIQSTGWNWSEGANKLVDEAPHGLLLKPLEYLSGNTTVGAVYDTIQYSIYNATADRVIDKNKAAFLATAHQKNNVILLSFDWRHIKNLQNLLASMSDYIAKNSEPNVDDNSLSLSLYDFDVIAIANRAELSWKTAKECNISNFEVQRTNVRNNKIIEFTSVADVEANSDNTIDNSYNNTDRNLEYSNTYAYRLKVNNFDGSYSYSENKLVTIEDAKFNVSEVSPNPANNLASFTITNGAEQNINAVVFDLSGKEVAVIANETLKAGTYTLNINASKLTAGSYTLIVRSNDIVVSKAFSVIK
jgi:hypothetical protein